MSSYIIGLYLHSTRNFDLILVQTKQGEIEKFVEGMGFSLQVRAGAKQSTVSAQPAAVPVVPGRAAGLGKQHRSPSLGEVSSRVDKATSAPVEAKVKHCAHFPVMIGFSD